MPERPAHHKDPDYKAAIEAVVEASESVGYRHIIGLFANDILDAALPHLRKMIRNEEAPQHVDG